MDKRKPVFSVKNVVMDFHVGGNGLFGSKRTIRALNDISFDLYPGESLAIVGESGCGKSTLCRIAMRFHQPTEGQMIFNEADVQTKVSNDFPRPFFIIESTA